jgi:hypothetical protein
MSATATNTSPDTNLANLVLALLTPMFLWSTAGDIRLARVAAAQTLNEYRVANRLSLFTVAKIIAFDIATLSSLSLSMYEDVSMLLALRLRGNATSLDRSAERNRRLWELEQASRSGAGTETEDTVEAAIAEAQRMVQQANARIRAAAEAAGTQPDADPVPVAEPAAVAAQAPSQVPPSAAAPAARLTAEQQPTEWPDEITEVAAAFAAGLEHVPPEEQWTEMRRIMAMTAAAAEIACGTTPPPVPAISAA